MMVVSLLVALALCLLPGSHAQLIQVWLPLNLSAGFTADPTGSQYKRERESG